MSTRKERRAAARKARAGGGGAPDALGLAVQHHQAGRFEQAQAAYRRILASHPRHADALHLFGVLHHQTGDAKAAIDLIREAIKANPRDPAFHYNLGEALRGAGAYAEAAESYRKAIALAPEAADAHYNLGNALYELGDLAPAEESYRRAIEFSPGDAEAHNNLGNVLMDRKRVDDATAQYETAIGLSPDYAEARANLGNALLQAGKPDEARACFEKALQTDPKLAVGRIGLGLLAEESGHADEAYGHFKRAVEADPESAEAQFAMARAFLARDQFQDAAGCCRRALEIEETAAAYHLLGTALSGMSRWQDAEDQFRRALELEPDHVEAGHFLGETLLEIGRPRDAMAAFERVLALDPEMAAAVAGIGNCWQQQGRFEEAEEALRRAVAMNPALSTAWLALATAKRLGSDDDIARLLELADDESLSDDQRRDILFALAHIHDDKGEHDAGFGYALAANDIRKKTSRFRADRWGRLTDALIARFSSALFARKADLGNPSELPVFVVGMPRSGTTLVEQIVASHEQAAGAGELYELQHMAAEIEDPNDGGRPYPDSIESLDRETAASMADAYIARLRQCSKTARRVVDKMPGNFVNVGLIALLFPKAHVIHCRRDPMDTCVSCFLQNFRNLDFTCDLAALGSYYRDYERLMRYWHEAAPVPILDVQYEDLVADPEAGSRRIIEFVGLDWDDRCLSFHQSKGQIRTASVWQARQPVFGSSVERWRRYEKHLGELKKALGGSPS